MKTNRMKRILCMFLCLTLVLPLFGCGGAEEQGGASAQTFSVGYGKANISPQHSVYLRGYGDPKEERMSTGVADPICATCIAITDAEGNTVILIATDLVQCKASTFDTIRKSVSEMTGVPVENIMASASHNHTGPDFADQVYATLLRERIPEACVAAMEDRKPAQMYTTICRPVGYNTVRHYLLADGSYQGYNVGGVPKSELIGHYGIADNLMQLVKFTREGDKDVVLINWQGHPKGSSPNSYTTATSNYPGVLRDRVEEALDCESLFFLSGSGNVNNGSQIPEEAAIAENYIELGEKLAEHAIEAAANFQPAKTDTIRTTSAMLTQDGVKGDLGVKLYAMSMGDLAFVFAPFEIFDTNAMAVKETSKFPMTFYASCSNDGRGYLPTPPSFDWEITYEANITKYPKGTAENVQAIFIELLDELFAAGGYTEQPKVEGYITPAFEPYTDGEYINPTPGDLTNSIPVKNGFYQIALVDGSKIRVFLAINEEVAQQVLQQATVKPLFNEQHVIIGLAE